MNHKTNKPKKIIAINNYDLFGKKTYSETHDASCVLNKDSKNKLKDQNYNANASESFTDNKNYLEDSNWKLKGKEDDDDNCCLKNTPCPLVDFQIIKIKQLVESGRPWMETEWDNIITSSDDAKDKKHDLRTYFCNQKLSILSPNHKIQLYKVGTFSNLPSYIDEFQNGIYDIESYLKKFKDFEQYSKDIPLFGNRNIKMCRPLEFSLPSASKKEMLMRYRDLIHRISLHESQKNFIIKDDSLEFREEKKNEHGNTLSSQVDNNIDVLNNNNIRSTSKKQEIDKDLLQLQNSKNDNQNLEPTANDGSSLRMEDDYKVTEKPGSPIAKHIRSELRSMRKQKSSETSVIGFNDNEAKARTHFEPKTNYLGIGPSYRGPGIYDEPFFKPEVKTKKGVKHKPDDPTFTYEILLGYSDVDQIDKVQKALLETTTVLNENTCEPTQDLVKLLKLLRDAHPPARKRTDTEEEKKADALREKLAHNHLCLVYKLQIECHDMNQIKMIEEAVLDSSVIVFSSVNPSFKPEPEKEPTLKVKLKERIKNIFNLGPLG